jgi:hypothetical protein
MITITSILTAICAVAVVAIGLFLFLTKPAPERSLKLVGALTLFVALGATLMTGNAKTGICLVTIMAIALVPWAHRYAMGLTITVQGKQIHSTLNLPANAEFNPDTFAQSIESLRSQVNAMLDGLPPLEQFEVTPELAYAFRCLTTSAANFLELSESIKATAARYAASVKAKADQDAETALLGKGEHIKKTDADAAATKAADDRETAVRASIADEAKADGEVTARRTKLVTDKVLPQLAAEALPKEFFKTEGYEDRVAKLTARVGKLTAKKLTAEPFVAEMVQIPLDEAGDKIFDSRVTAVESLSSSAARGGERQAGSRAALPSDGGRSAEEPEPEPVAAADVPEHIFI